ncbi:MAG: GGDEF domain-containing protein [Candidatus Izemoplasmatales bacterium]
MFKRLFGLSSTIDPEYRKLFDDGVRRRITMLNAKRGFVILITGIIIELFLIAFYDVPNLIQNGLVRELGIYYLLCHAMILSVSLFGTFRSYRMLTNKKVKAFNHVPFTFFAIVVSFVFITCIALINSMDQRMSSNIMLYGVFVLIIGALVLIEPKYMAMVLFSGHFFFVVGMILFQKDPELLVLNLTNGTIAVFCSFIVSVIFYTNFYEIHLKTLMLEDTTTKLQILSNTDPLTKIYNRRYFYEYLGEEHQKGIYTKQLAFILFDIDSFKQINDTYGHIVGDEALVYFSKILSDTCNQHDLAVRWGGEEFLLVLTNRSEKEVIELTREILRSCKSAYSETLEHSIKITASAGISYTEQFDIKDIDHYISRTDEAMYESKKNGKNQLTVWNKEKTSE